MGNARVYRGVVLAEVSKAAAVEATGVFGYAELSYDPGIAYTRTVTGRLMIDFDFDGTYDDESARIISISGKHSLVPPEQSVTSTSGKISQMSVVLHNADGYYSALLSGTKSAYMADGGSYHLPIYFEVSLDGGGYERVFTGVTKIPRENSLSSRQAPTITLDCRSQEEALLQVRMNTTAFQLQSWYSTGLTESELMAAILTHGDIGLDSGDYTLDPGLFTIPFFWAEDDSPIELCWQLAAAAGGRFYANADGKFVYENAQHWLVNHATPTESLTTGDFASAYGVYLDKELYKTVIVSGRARNVGEEVTLWNADQNYTIPASSTITITAKTSVPMFSVSPITNGTHYKARSSGGAVNLTGYVNLTDQTNYAQYVELEFTNSHPTYAAVLFGLYLEGRPITGENLQDVKSVSTNSFWDNVDGNSVAKYRPDRTRLLTGNNWVQTDTQTTFLSQYLLGLQETPKLFFNLRDVLGEGGRRVGDRIQITDPNLATNAQEGYITDIQWRFGGGTFLQDLQLIDASSLYPYDGNYFIIGTDLLDATTSERVFY